MCSSFSEVKLFELIFYSKWFLQAVGLQGLNDMLAGFEDKSAQAVCTFAYSEGPGHKPIIFQGRTDVSLPSPCNPSNLLMMPAQGKIVPPRGPTNFGEMTSLSTPSTRSLLLQVGIQYSSTRARRKFPSSPQSSIPTTH